MLLQEVKQLKRENEALLDDREPFQRDIQNSTDYIVQLEEKYFNANQTCIELLQQLRQLDLQMKEREESHKEGLEKIEQDHKE